MPNNKNERKGKQTGELSAEERFRNFFSTSVIDLPEEMTHRDEPAPVEEKPKAGLLGKLFGHDKEETPAAAQPVLEIPTGEILLGADARPVQPEQEDMALELRTADPVPVMPMQPAHPEPVKAVPAEPVPAPKAAAAVKLASEKPVPQPKPQPAAAPQKQPKAKNAPEILLPQEELEQREMQQLKDMLNGMSGKAKPAPQPAKPVQAAPQPKVQPAPAQPATEPEKAPAKAAQKAAEELPPVVFASAPADPEMLPKKPEKKSIFQMFGTAEDEKPAARKPEKEDTMSLPLLPLEQDGAPADETVPAPAADAAVTPAQPETAPEAAVPTEEAVPESTTDKLHHMAAELTLRCVLAGILAVVLLHLGLTAERLLPPLSVLDPDAAPAAFYAANLLLFAASLFVGYPVLRDGLAGLRGRPSADTMPALAAVAALLQAVVAMLNANAYRSTEGIGLLTGMAALGLFLALVGSRVMLSAVQGGYTLAAEGGELRGAYRTRDKDLIRALARDLEQKDPWVLLSRPVQTASDDFVEQSLSERASERRARKVACVLLAAAVLSGVAFLLFGGGTIPTYIVISKLGLMNTIWALTLPGAMNVSYMILIMNFFRGIPTEIEDAAVIDGANQLQILFRVYLPMSMPSLATIILFATVANWNCWMDGYMYMNTPDKYPLQTYLATILMESKNNVETLMTPEQLIRMAKVSEKTIEAAQIFLAALPIMCVYPFLQKYYTKGIVVGSVKG